MSRQAYAPCTDVETTSPSSRLTAANACPHAVTQRRSRRKNKIRSKQRARHGLTVWQNGPLWGATASVRPVQETAAFPTNFFVSSRLCQASFRHATDGASAHATFDALLVRRSWAGGTA